jgi:hypothetical protein
MEERSIFLSDVEQQGHEFAACLVVGVSVIGLANDGENLDAP